MSECAGKGEGTGYPLCFYYRKKILYVGFMFSFLSFDLTNSIPIHDIYKRMKDGSNLFCVVCSSRRISCIGLMNEGWVGVNRESQDDGTPAGREGGKEEEGTFLFLEVNHGLCYTLICIDPQTT